MLGSSILKTIIRISHHPDFSVQKSEPRHTNKLARRKRSRRNVNGLYVWCSVHNIHLPKSKTKIVSAACRLKSTYLPSFFRFFRFFLLCSLYSLHCVRSMRKAWREDEKERNVEMNKSQTCKSISRKKQQWRNWSYLNTYRDNAQDSFHSWCQSGTLFDILDSANTERRNYTEQ